MPAPSLNSPRAPWPPGRRSKAANGGNRGRWRTDQRALWELYERDRCQEGAIPYLLFSFLVTHSFVRPEETHHSFAPTLASAGARRARSVKDGAIAPARRGLSLTDRAPR